MIGITHVWAGTNPLRPFVIAWFQSALKFFRPYVLRPRFLASTYSATLATAFAVSSYLQGLVELMSKVVSKKLLPLINYRE